MGDGFGVDSDEVRSHATKIAQVSDRLGSAASAASTTTLNNEAFGLIGQFLVPVVMSVEGVVTATIKSAESQAESTFNSLRQTADDYDSTDAEAAAPSQVLRGEIL